MNCILNKFTLPFLLLFREQMILYRSVCFVYVPAMEKVSGSPWTAVQTAVAIGSVQTAVAAALEEKRSKARTTAHGGHTPWMSPPESGASTYASGASEEQRKDNKKAVEERRDILVAAIEEHDGYMIAMLRVDCSTRGVKVCIPTPMVMEDCSCGKTIEQDKRHVHKRVQWLNK